MESYYIYILQTSFYFLASVILGSGVLIGFVMHAIKKQTKIGKYLIKLFEL